MILENIVDLAREASPCGSSIVPSPARGRGRPSSGFERCGVCHTELDEIEGRTPPPRLPVIPGHQVVGRVVENGAGANASPSGPAGGRVDLTRPAGSAPSAWAETRTSAPNSGPPGATPTAGYCRVHGRPEAFAQPIPEVFSDAQAAPLLCAGASGYRSLRLTGLRDGQVLGLTGFGASGHLVLKAVRRRFPGSKVFVFARSEAERAFALELGASWAGDTADRPPEPCDAVIDTTPAWGPVVEALASLKSGGRLVINAIRKEEGDRDRLLHLDYPAHLWLEKEIKSVANVARADVREFLELAAGIPILPEVREYSLGDANQALAELKDRKIRGAKVLRM